MIQFLKYKKIYYIFSATLVFASIFSLAYFGLNLGIEFEGGNVMEIEYQEKRPSSEKIREQLFGLELGEVSIQPVGEKGFIIRTKEVTDNVYLEIRSRLGDSADEKYFDTISPVVGQELRQKALISILLASLAIIIYIAITFGGAGTRAVNSWQYGLVASGIGFFHDVLIVLEVFSVLGYFYGIQITIPIAVALLTILGYSINDTVVIFDRIRENLGKRVQFNFNEIVNKSLNETLSRSVSTSLTTLFVLFSILFFGGETLRWFVSALILGIFLGTYSSIFLSGPLLTSWFGLKTKKNV